MSTTPKPEYCADCRFWLAQEPNWGFCRRYPPQVITSCVTEWPETKCQEWCGEFQPRPPAENLTAPAHD